MEHVDDEQRWRAVQGQDARFDGWFVLGVTSTGIYCRPSCPARTPRRENVRFHPTAAAAQAAGFRACRRCRPDASPGSPAWDGRSDLVARAVRLVADGVVDREGVPGLATRLGYSRRQVERALVAELGAGPLALARAQRAQTARTLLETTALPLADVAFAAGFGSVRQFNDTVRAVYAGTPGELRARRTVTPAAGEVQLRLPFRAPLHPDQLFGHLAATAVPGVEEWRDGAYRRTLRLPHGSGVVALTPGPEAVGCRLWLPDLRDLPAAVARCRRLLDLDADPVAVDGLLGQDEALAPWVAKVPGRRVPRTVDEGELALRAVLGQQVSTAAARTHAARLVQAAGEPVVDPAGGLTHLFPTAAAVAQVPDAVLALPATRRATLRGLAAALADGRVDLDPGADRDRARAQLLALPGIGPWTADTVAMRALGDPDAFLAGDLGVRVAAGALGLGKGAALLARSARWAPYRAYAVQHLWGTADHAINRLPTGGHP
ncbi:MAG TPA: AlkA N-terminal domain-containing protein [Mycobacteriales bacterium]|jgi:AraC family transcriptional regulator of adaptative response / DNA-3-methyladenine glycosylase II|nr:AlkA N-terminal domain-containing protein [Mycobacteriales bacterium]